MVSSLQSIVLYSVPIATLFDMFKMLHRLPMGKECLRALFRRCTHEELRDWAKTLPWNHPVARSLDHEVHRRRMAGESHLLYFPLPRCGFLHTPFFLIRRRVPVSRFSTASPVACPPLSLSSTSQTQLGLAFFFSESHWILDHFNFNQEWFLLELFCVHLFKGVTPLGRHIRPACN